MSAACYGLVYVSAFAGLACGIILHYAVTRKREPKSKDREVS